MSHRIAISFAAAATAFRALLPTPQRVAAAAVVAEGALPWGASA